MKVVKKVCKTEKETQEAIRKLKKAGFRRSHNCYWVEIWTDGESEYVISRDF